MRILIVNSMFVNALYRKCADELGRFPGIELTVLTTESWVMNGRVMPLDPVDAKAPYKFIAAKAGWKGKENRGFYREGLIKTLRMSRPDAIYLMEEPFSLFATQLLAVRKLVCPDVPVIFFTWNNLSLIEYDYRPSIAYRTLAKLNLRSLESALTANTDGIEVLRRFGYQRSATTVGYGVDTSHYSSTRVERVRKLKEDLGIGPADRVIGYVGRILHMKGIDLLIKAFADVAHNDLHLKLLLLGSGEYEKQVDSLIAEYGLADRVLRVAVVPHASVPDYMHTLDILVLPSRRVGMWAEQFGRVLIEAMAAKKIVIGSDSGAIPEVIGDAGFVFRENDAADLARKLRQALSLENNDLEVLQARAYERATQTYSWNRFVTSSLAVIRGAVERSRQ